MSHQTQITSGTFTLGDNGQSTIHIPLTNTSGTGVTDRIYTISTTVNDPDGHSSVSTSTTADVFRASTFVGMKLDQPVYEMGDTANVGFITVDRAGNPVPHSNISFSAERISYATDPNTLQYSEQDTTVSTGTFQTDNNGLANTTLAFTDAGEYKLAIILADGTYTTTQTIYVS